MQGINLVTSRNPMGVHTLFPTQRLRNPPIPLPLSSPLRKLRRILYPHRRSLRTALLNTPTLSFYAPYVKLYSCPSIASSTEPSDVIVGLLTPLFALIIDAVTHPEAILIPVNSSLNTTGWTTYSGQNTWEPYTYFLESGSGAQCPTLTFSDGYCGFTAVGLGAEVIPSVCIIDTDTDADVPASVDTKPKFSVTTLRMRIGFAAQDITIQIPYLDWLVKNKRNRELKAALLENEE
ncbi:hypothetical protein BCR34DRAFT_585185 [Clohesyomyces aquaticus]|uniref:Uncharacterized protein n=1 Tax=Clohesyomyces aquaticus TaxID=1231657 RepID=A0A1Y1ZYJ5_9PLEO|nr:hypothetical protein BCR34DRAFT_585185 [Clohesyomyces aquaticus]